MTVRPMLSTLKKPIFFYFSMIILGLAIVFWKFLSLRHFFIFDDIGSDTISLFYPELLEDVRSIRSNGIPFWSFAKGIGQSNFNKDLLSPFTWIYVLLGTKYLAYGIGLVQFLKAIVIGISVFHIFSLQGIEKRACLYGAGLISFMGYAIVGAAWYGHSTNIMFMLLFLLGIELWMAERKWWLIPIAALFLLGPPLLFVGEFTIIYLLIRIFLSGSPSLNQVKQIILNAWKPALTAILIAAPFLGAILYKFLYSPRVGGSASYSEALSSIGIFSFNTAEHYATIIYRFFSNDLLGTGDAFSGVMNYLEAPLFYCGLSTLLIFPQVFRFLNQKQRIVFGGVLGLWLMMLIFPYFRYAFYFFVGNYYKSALSLFIPFTLIWSAVLVFHQLSKGGKLNLILLWIWGSFLSVLLFSVSKISPDITVDPKTQVLVFVFLLVQIILFSVHHFLNEKELWLSAILIAVLVEGTVLSYPAINDRQSIATERFENREFYEDYAIEAIKYIDSQEEGFYRIEKSFGSFMTGLNDSQAQGFFDTKSYSSHNHNNYVKFMTALDMIDPADELSTRWLPGMFIAPELHPFFQIKYVINQPGTNGEIVREYYENLGDLKGLNVYKNKTPVPFGFAVSSYITESDFKALGSYYKRLNALYNTVVLPDEEVHKFQGLTRKSLDQIYSKVSLSTYSRRYANNALQLSSFSQSKIAGSIQLEKPSFLVFSFPFDAGWKAKVNGKKASLTEIDNGLTGLYLDSGSSEVVLKYRPPFFGIGLLGFLTGISGLLYFTFIRKSSDMTPLVSPVLLNEVAPRVASPSKIKASTRRQTEQKNTGKIRRRKK